MKDIAKLFTRIHWDLKLVGMDIRSYLVRIYRQTEQDGMLYLRVIFKMQLMVLRGFLMAMILITQLGKLLLKWFFKWAKVAYLSSKVLYLILKNKGTRNVPQKC